MLTLSAINLEQTPRDIYQIESIFKKIVPFKGTYVFRSFYKKNPKFNHFSLLKSPHVHKKAMSQYGFIPDYSYKIDFFTAAGRYPLRYLPTLSLYRGAPSIRPALRAFNKLNQLTSLRNLVLIRLLLTKCRLLETNGIFIKKAQSKVSLVFVIFEGV